MTARVCLCLFTSVLMRFGDIHRSSSNEMKWIQQINYDSWVSLPCECIAYAAGAVKGEEINCKIRRSVYSEVNIEFSAKTMTVWTQNGQKKIIEGTKLIHTLSGDKILRKPKEDIAQRCKISSNESVRILHENEMKWKYNVLCQRYIEWMLILYFNAYYSA